MRRAREESVKLAQAANVNASLEGDLNLLKDYRPNWIKNEDWEKVINEVWTTSKWKLLTATLKRPPTGVELYAKLHTEQYTQDYITLKVAKVQEAYERAMMAKYGDDTSCHPHLDNETWCDVFGRIKKGRIYGFGFVSDPTSFLEGTSSTIASIEVHLILYFIKFLYHGIVLTKFPIMV
uniref:Uncharacterized protein n=1 Tax=Lactuca sativa TaxID=4236 RepID=A0A9R1XNH2_LACSA|nr:hypothetical protein LSAT_V11C300121670 [Lactuca sativa]